MKISMIRLCNFRKLLDVKLDMEEDTTLLVGANNSGKTSLVESIRKFFKYSSFVMEDFTITNFKKLNDIGDCWSTNIEDKVNLDEFIKYCPSLDIWIDGFDGQLRYISKLLPTLDYEYDKIGVRLIYQPKSLEDLKVFFCDEYKSARKLESENSEVNAKVSPNDLCEYLKLNGNLNSKFNIHSYILDPDKENDLYPQRTDLQSEINEENPLSKLIKIDFINAQRGLSDPDTKNDGDNNRARLSRQLKNFYDSHLRGKKVTTVEELHILKSIQDAKFSMDNSLKERFKGPICELEEMGYPGFSNPKIHLTAKLDEAKALDDDSSLKYCVLPGIDEQDKTLYLPEQYNGLGFQNLISIVFKLIGFRENWINKRIESSEDFIEPIHLVMIEEPEAHLHVQVQQVFIEKAYSYLTNNEIITENSCFKTQLLMSTHSSSIVKSSQFASLRYFRRYCDKENGLTTSCIVTISKIFNKAKEQQYTFTKRYLQSTKNDIFFADAVIVVEGSSENILLPYFIKQKYKRLDSMYISIMLLDGRHFQKVKPLFDKLDIPLLLITDIDTASSRGYHKHKRPEEGKNLISSNFTIKQFFNNNKYDKLLLKKNEDKSKSFEGSQEKNYHIVYQTPINLRIDKEPEIVKLLASTFEDSLIYTNFNDIKSSKIENDEKCFINEIKKLIEETNINNIQEKIYKKIRESSNSKTQLALDLINFIAPDQLIVPEYIDEGLNWLIEKLNKGEV